MHEIQEINSPEIQEKYHYFRTSSGLDIYVIPKKLSTTYAIFGTKYGSLENCFKTSKEQDFVYVPNGVAHFLEHKMFENEDGSDTFERFGALGASANAYTSNEITAYLFSCTSDFAENLKILLDYVQHPYFTEENVQKEQGIIGEEIGMYDDNANFRLYYNLLELLYHNHPIKINICGTEDTISQITPEILYRCYHAFYQLHNMALVICGDVDPYEIQKISEVVLLPTVNCEVECTYPEEPANIAKKQSSDQMEVANPLFAIGVKDINLPTDLREQKKRAIAVNMLNDLLFGTSSAFYNTLYEQGLTKSGISSEYEALKNCAHNILSGDSADPEAVFDFYRSFIEKSKKDFPQEEDFLRIRRMTYAEYIRTFDSTEDIANEFIQNLFSGVNYFEIGKLIQEIDYPYVYQIFTELFQEEFTAYACIFPKKGE